MKRLILLSFLIIFLINLPFEKSNYTLAEPGLISNFFNLESSLGQKEGIAGYEIGAIGSMVIERVESYIGEVVQSFIMDKLQYKVDKMADVVEKGICTILSYIQNIYKSFITVQVQESQSPEGAGGSKECQTKEQINSQTKALISSIATIYGVNLPMFGELLRQNFNTLSAELTKNLLVTRITVEIAKILREQDIPSLEEFTKTARQRGEIKGLRSAIKELNCLSEEEKRKLISQEDGIGKHLVDLQVFDYIRGLIFEKQSCLGATNPFEFPRKVFEILTTAKQSGEAEVKRAEEETGNGKLAPKISCTEKIKLDTGEKFCLQYIVITSGKQLAQIEQETHQRQGQQQTSSQNPENLLKQIENLKAESLLEVALGGYYALSSAPNLESFFKNYYKNIEKSIDTVCKQYSEMEKTGQKQAADIKSALGGIISSIISSLLSGIFPTGKGKTYFVCKLLLKKQLTFIMLGKEAVDSLINKTLRSSVNHLNSITQKINNTTQRIQNIGNKLITLMGPLDKRLANLPPHLAIARLAQTNEDQFVPPEIISKYLQAAKEHEDIVAQQESNISEVENYFENQREDTTREYIREVTKNFSPDEAEYQDVLKEIEKMSVDLHGKIQEITKRLDEARSVVNTYSQFFDASGGLAQQNVYPIVECGGKTYGYLNCQGESTAEETGGGGHKVASHVCKNPIAVRGRYGGGTEDISDCKKAGDGTEICERATVVTSNLTGEELCAALACVHWKDDRWMGAFSHGGKMAYLDSSDVAMVCNYLGLPVPGKVGCSQCRPDLGDDCDQDWAEVNGNVIRYTAESQFQEYTECKYTHTTNNGPHPNNCCKISFNFFEKTFAVFLNFVKPFKFNLFAKAQSLDNIIEFVGIENGSRMELGKIVPIKIKFAGGFSDAENFMESLREKGLEPSFSRFLRINVHLQSIDTNEKIPIKYLRAPDKVNETISFDWVVGTNSAGRMVIQPGKYKLLAELQTVEENYVTGVDIELTGELPSRIPLEYQYPEKEIKPTDCDWAYIYNPDWLFRIFPSGWKARNPIDLNMCGSENSSDRSRNMDDGGRDGGDGGRNGGDGGRNGGDGGGPPKVFENKLIKTIISFGSFIKKVFAVGTGNKVEFTVNGQTGPQLYMPASTTVTVSWKAENASYCEVLIRERYVRFSINGPVLDTRIIDPKWATSTNASALHHIYQKNDKGNEVKEIAYKLKCFYQPSTFVNREIEVVPTSVGTNPPPSTISPPPTVRENEDIITSLKRFLMMLGGEDQKEFTSQAKRRYWLEGVSTSSQPTTCGDGICSVGENTNNCPQDCSATQSSGDDSGDIDFRRYLYFKIKEKINNFLASIERMLSFKVYGQLQLCKNCNYNKGQRRFLADIINIAYMDLTPWVEKGRGSFLGDLISYLGSKLLNTNEGFPPNLRINVTTEQLAEVKAYLELKHKIALALLKYAKNYEKLDIVFNGTQISTVKFLEDYENSLRLLISILNDYLGGLEEQISEFQIYSEMATERARNIQETQDRVLPTVIERVANSNSQTYVADIERINERASDLSSEVDRINYTLDEVEAALEEYQAKINSLNFFAQRQTQKLSEIPSLPKLIKSIFKPKKINVKGVE